MQELQKKHLKDGNIFQNFQIIFLIKLIFVFLLAKPLKNI